MRSEGFRRPCALQRHIDLKILLMLRFPVGWTHQLLYFLVVLIFFQFN
jgi:hypothetical protein